MNLNLPKRLRGVKTAAHARAPKQEREVAARLGGHRIKGSGSGDEKGDVRVRRVLRIESKCTERKSFSVTREMIDKIEQAALSSGELPAMQIEFIDDKGKVTHTCCVMPAWALEMVVGAKDGAA